MLSALLKKTYLGQYDETLFPYNKSRTVARRH